MNEWVEILTKFGFPTMVAIYLLWQNKKDKDAISARMNDLEEFCRNDLKEISEASTTVIAENNEILIRNTKALEKCTVELAKKEVA
jgi:hypothetical protein